MVRRCPVANLSVRNASCFGFSRAISVPKVRDFTETFAIVGLPPSAPNMAYGLAEHTVGCSSFSPNLEGAALSSIADDRLQSSGDVAYSLSIGVTVSDGIECS